jgi:hypothetical protein
MKRFTAHVGRSGLPFLATTPVLTRRFVLNELSMMETTPAGMRPQSLNFEPRKNAAGDIIQGKSKKPIKCAGTPSDQSQGEPYMNLDFSGGVGREEYYQRDKHQSGYIFFLPFVTVIVSLFYFGWVQPYTNFWRYEDFKDEEDDLPVMDLPYQGATNPFTFFIPLRTLFWIMDCTIDFSKPPTRSILPIYPALDMNVPNTARTRNSRNWPFDVTLAGGQTCTSVEGTLCQCALCQNIRAVE